MPPSLIKKRRRPGQGLAEDGAETQLKLAGFKTSIVRPIVDPRSKPQIQKEAEEAGESFEHFEILSDFDLDHRFGPCSEISRSQRLARAKKFGLPVGVNVEKCISDRAKAVGGDLSVSTIDTLMMHYGN